MWHNKKPQIKYLRIFGSTIYVHNKTSKTKFDEKSRKGILVGYVTNGYKVWDLEKGDYIVARDVIVDENDFSSSKSVHLPERRIDEEAPHNKIDVSEDISKSIEGAEKSDEGKSDTSYLRGSGNRADIFGKSVVDPEQSDIDKSDKLSLQNSMVLK